MKRVLLVGAVAGLGLMAAVAGHGSLGLGLLAPDDKPYDYTGAGPSLLGSGGPNWIPRPAPPFNPHWYDDPYPAGKGGSRKQLA